MASRFKGRDYNSLRGEILSFLKTKLPDNWDDTNLSDPVVIFSESLARLGDQLHYTIDELRRECDIATAQRKSSIYSYALREGYRMLLPKGSSGRLLINLAREVDGVDTSSNILHLEINKFDPIKTTSSLLLYAANDINADLHIAPDIEYISNLRSKMEKAYLLRDESKEKSADYIKKATDYSVYMNTLDKLTQKLDVVLGELNVFNFSYSDIDNDSTVVLPEPLIDRDLLQLIVIDKGIRDDNSDGNGWKCVDDIIGSGFVGKIYSLTPKFINGSIRLCIEFPTNFRDLFSSSAKFEFKYIAISNNKITDPLDIDLSDYLKPADAFPEAEVDNKYLSIDIGNGILGYTEYEDPNIVRENYKRFIQDYSSLLTKDDYVNYIKAHYTDNCMVFDHSDNYKTDVLPPGTELEPRVIYVLTDALYKQREAMWRDLKERSGRSDCIVMIPYGKDPYTIIVKADCYLLGTSVSSISTAIKKSLLEYYSDHLGDRVPNTSSINYLVHKASDKVIAVENLIVRDTTYGLLNTDFNDVANLSNEGVDELFSAIKNGSFRTYKSPISGEYTLQGILNKPTGEKDEDGNDIYEVVPGTEYNKYPVHFYEKWPANFPNVCTSNGIAVNEYENIIDYQSDYLLDNPAWDLRTDESTYEKDANRVLYCLTLNYIIDKYLIKDELKKALAASEVLNIDTAKASEYIETKKILYAGKLSNVNNLYAELSALTIPCTDLVTKGDAELCDQLSNDTIIRIGDVTFNNTEDDNVVIKLGLISLLGPKALPGTPTIVKKLSDEITLSNGTTITKEQLDMLPFESMEHFNKLDPDIIKELSIVSEHFKTTFETYTKSPIKNTSIKINIFDKLSDERFTRLPNSILKYCPKEILEKRLAAEKYSVKLAEVIKEKELDNPTISAADKITELPLQGNFMTITKSLFENTVNLKDSYVQHHYMMPWLNNVVVLVRVIGNVH